MAPYLWRYAPIKNLQHMWWDFTAGVSNLVRWFPVVWRDRDFDHAYLLAVMEFKFKSMADSFERRSMHVNGERDVRQLRVCAELCKRLREDEYLERHWDRTTKASEKATIGLPDEIARQDQRALGIMIGRHLRRWWY